MKKQLLSVLSFLMLCIGIQAQTNIANYTFAKSISSYSPLSSPTILGAATAATGGTTSLDGTNYRVTFPSGFTFSFDGVAQTDLNINSNGYVGFSTALWTGNTTSPLANAPAGGTTTGIISGFARDLNAVYNPTASVVGDISYELTGIAPDRKLVVQYKNFKPYSSVIDARLLNFQIHLFESTHSTSPNHVEMVYGICNIDNSTATDIKVGLRGNSTTWANNVNSLMIADIPAGTTCDWTNVVTSNTNTSNLIFTNTNTSVSIPDGLVYHWAPPAVVLAPVRLFNAVSGITSSGAAISWTIPVGATQYNVQYRIPGTCSWTNFSGNPVLTNTATLTGLNSGTVYQIRVQSSDATNNAIWSHIPAQTGTGSGYVAAGTFSTLGIPVDLQTTSLQAPTVSATGCYGSSVPVVIQIKNAGTTILDFSLNNATVVTNITGTNPQSFTTTVNTGTLAPGATQNVTVTATYNMSAVGVYTIDATSTLATPDANTTNDAMVADTRTNIAPINAPFTNNFTGFTGANLSSVFPGWNEGTGSPIPSGTTSGWVTQTGLNGTGNITAKINLFSNTKNDWILTPKFAVTTGVSLQFDAAITGFNSLTADAEGMTGTDDKVDVMISTDCGNTFTSLLSITQTNSLTPAFTPFSVNLSAYVGQNVIIGFLASDGTINDVPDYDFHIDNINIASCFAPTGLTTSNITTTSVDLSWTAPITGSPASYIGEIRTSGAAGSGTLGLVSTGTVTAPTTTTNITALTALTAYTVYVRSDCGASDFSQWISTTFTSLANCQVPTALNTSTVLATSANFTWTAGGTETAWDIYYGAQPLTVPTATTAPTGTSSATSYSASGLTQVTAYSVYVRANCGAGSSSVWTAVKNFTTPVSCPAPLSLVVSGITPTTANATWLPGASEPSWLVNYMAPTTTVVTGSPSYSLTGLNPSTSYSIQVKGICAVGDSSTWTAFTTFMTPCLPPSILTTTPSSRCGAGTTTLSATGDVGATLNWYTNSIGGTAVGTGTLFTTPTITTTTDFYVSAVGGLITENVGRVSAASATGFITTPNWGIIFTTTKNVLVNSATIYPVGTGSVTIALLDATGAELAVTPAIAVTGTGTNTPVVVNLGFNVPTGNNFKIVLKAYTGITNLIRDGSGNVFPYTSASNALSVTGGWTGTASSGSYYWFYNLNISTGCESARTAVTASVTAPPVLSVTSGSTICANAIQTLSVTSTLSDFDNYVWTPNTNLFTDGGATTAYTGNNQSVLYYSSPLNNNTTYTLTATNTLNGCVNNTTVSMEATMPVIYASANPTLLCSGSTVSLTANTDIIATGTVTTGTATTLTGATAQPTAFCNRWSSYRMQTVYTASELTGFGLASGNITSISYSISTLGDAATNANFTVKCGTTTATAFTNFIATTGFSTVFTPAIYTHSVGLNTIIFNTPYFWDGVSNLVIEVSHDGANGINNSQTYYTATVANTVAWSTNGGATGTLSKNRLNTIINGQTISQGVGTVTWQWNPGAINSNTTVVTPINTGTTATTESYTVTALDPATTCTNSAVVNFSVSPLPTVIATASSASVCAGSSATLTASGATNYTWTAAGTASTQVVTLSSASVYTVTGETNGCSNTTTVSVGVNQIPTVSVSASNTLVCSNIGESSTLTASTSATSYTWSTTENTSVITVTPSVGTTYSLTVSDGTCEATATVFVDAQVCSGVNELVANGIGVYPNPTNGIVNISISSELAGNTSIEVYDAIGKLTIKENLTSNTTTINTSKLVDGIYVYKIMNNNTAIKIGKIVKQ